VAKPVKISDVSRCDSYVVSTVSRDITALYKLY